MKHIGALALIIALLLCTARAQEIGDEPIKEIDVLCVGDSITFGATTQNPLRDSYPAQMKKLKGALKIKGANCGVSSMMVRKDSTRAYTGTRAYETSLKATPDAVLLMLGTNDAFAWRDGYFEDDYMSLVEVYQSLPSHPVVFVLLPPKIIKDEGADKILTDKIIPILKNVADLYGCPLIDLNTFSIDKAEFFPDGLHPNKEGYGLIAQYIYDQLTAYYAQETEEQPT